MFRSLGEEGEGEEVWGKEEGAIGNRWGSEEVRGRGRIRGGFGAREREGGRLEKHMTCGSTCRSGKKRKEGKK
jgi:hypothetical protein